MRGQTLIETVIMMPVALFAVFGILYIAHFGIVNERTYLAMRYAGVASFLQGQSDAYTAANVYTNLTGGRQPIPCPTAPAGAFTNTAPYPGPQSPTLWNPDIPVTSACTTTFTDYGGASFLAGRFIASTAVTVNTGVNVPAYLRPLIGSIRNTSTLGSFAHAAYPGIILYCVSQAYNATHDALTALGTVGLPTPMPGQPTPPPGNGSC